MILKWNKIICIMNICMTGTWWFLSTRSKVTWWGKWLGTGIWRFQPKFYFTDITCKHQLWKNTQICYYECGQSHGWNTNLKTTLSCGEHFWKVWWENLAVQQAISAILECRLQCQGNLYWWIITGSFHLSDISRRLFFSKSMAETKLVFFYELR